jgi:hypothetical protein
VIAPPSWADSWREVLHIAFNVVAAVLLVAAIVLVGVFDVVGVWLVLVAVPICLLCALVNHGANERAGRDFPDY